jgi:WD40 repeat protein
MRCTLRIVLVLGIGTLALTSGAASAQKGDKTAAPVSGPALRDLFGVRHLAYLPDGASLVIDYSIPLGSVPPNQGKSAIGIWDVKTGKFRVGLEKVMDHVDQIALSPDGGKVAAVAAGKRELKVWDSGTGKLLEEFSLPEWKNFMPFAPLLAFSADGQSITTVQGQKLLQARLGGKVSVLVDELERWAPDMTAHSRPANLIAFASNPPIGQKADSKLLVYDLARPAEPRTVPLKGWVRSIAFASDGKTLVISYEGSTGNSGKVELWDVGTWKVRTTLPKEKRKAFWSYRRLYFSPDDKFMVGSPTGDRAARAVDVLDAEGKLIREILDAQEITDVAFTPDSKTVAIIVGRKPILFLDPTTGEEKAP